MRKRLVIAGLVSMVGSLIIVEPASALTSDSIFVPKVASAGGGVVVEVPSVLTAKSCAIYLQGPKKSKSTTYKVRKYTLKVKVPTSGLPVGQYRAVVSCRGDGKAVSSPFALVAKGEPLRATCDVVDKGFSLTEDSGVNAGFVLRNASSVLSASSITVSMNFRDASGNLLASARSSTPDIPPGGAVIGGEDALLGEKAPGATSMEIVTSCEDAYSPAPPVAKGPVAFTPQVDPGDGLFYTGLQMRAVVTNTTGATLGDGSSISYLVRNASGQITGGTWFYLGAVVPPGGQTLQENFSSVLPANATSVEYMVSADSPF